MKYLWIFAVVKGYFFNFWTLTQNKKEPFPNWIVRGGGFLIASDIRIKDREISLPLPIKPRHIG
jgi:hypothetical protein